MDEERVAKQGLGWVPKDMKKKRTAKDELEKDSQQRSR